MRQKSKHCWCKSCVQSICENGTIHLSSCAVHNEPAEPKGKCDCKRESIPLIDAMAEFCHNFPKSAKIHNKYLIERAKNLKSLND